MAQPAFNIFDALSAWGKTLPGWQHFLLSKLVATVELSDDTLDVVFTEYLSPEGKEDVGSAISQTPSGLPG